MIKNQTIIDKVNEKTEDDLIMRKFIKEILNFEEENSQFKNGYEKIIAKTLKEM